MSRSWLPVDDHPIGAPLIGDGGDHGPLLAPSREFVTVVPPRRAGRSACSAVCVVEASRRNLALPLQPTGIRDLPDPDACGHRVFPAIALALVAARYRIHASVAPNAGCFSLSSVCRRVIVTYNAR